MHIPFLQARHYRRGPRSVDLVVIHSAEIGESLEGAEALQRVCASVRRYPKGHPREGQEIVSSWHYAVDADSITQSVRDEDIAFHAPGANHHGIGIELSGRARQTAEEWSDDFSTRMLELAAGLVAEICRRWSIPVVFVPRETLRLPGARGITAHVEVSKAFGKSDHWDPGPHFPIAWFLARVRASAPDTEPAPPPSESIAPELPTLREGSSGWAVVELQRRLAGLAVDGAFGPKTRAAVIAYQRSRGLVPDGIVGPATWRALLSEVL